MFYLSKIKYSKRQFCFPGGRPDSPSGVTGAGYPGAAGPPTQNMYSSCKLQGPPSPPETKVEYKIDILTID